MTATNGRKADPVDIAEEPVAIADLRSHPRNYQTHGDDQVEHLMASIREFGFFRNIVIARDNTILAGHGAVEAATRLGMETVPARRLDLDPDSPAALKVVALDNEVGRFADRDDRALTELLRVVAAEAPSGLLGTGYDEMILANLLMVTRPTSEVRNADLAAEWVGMPDYEPEGDTWKFVVQFESEADRERFLTEYQMREVTAVVKMTPFTVSAWWPKPTTVRHDGGLRWAQPGDDEGILEPT